MPITHSPDFASRPPPAQAKGAIATAFEDVGLLLLALLLLPVAILLIGAPLGAIVWLITEFTRLF